MAYDHVRRFGSQLMPDALWEALIGGHRFIYKAHKYIDLGNRTIIMTKQKKGTSSIPTTTAEITFEKLFEKSVGTTELHYSTKKWYHVLDIRKSLFSSDNRQSMKLRIATER